jgi:Methylamine utilisation protein MauE
MVVSYATTSSSAQALLRVKMLLSSGAVGSRATISTAARRALEALLAWKLSLHGVPSRGEQVQFDPMSALVGTGLITTLAVVLISAGLSKARRPAPVRRALQALGASTAAAVELARALTAVELTIAVVALTAPAAVAGLVLAGLFACFAIASLLLARKRQAVGCGCFGEEEPPGRLHVILNAVAAVAAAVVAAQAPPSLVQLARTAPGSAIAVLAGACVAAAIWRFAFTAREAPAATPVSDRLVDASAMFLEQRISRRSALARIVLAGSAFCVAPLRYLLYPGPALAVIVPGSCASGECTDGYTAFCCQINKGLNECPSGTFAGGWWMCTDYTGRMLCAPQGVRYYVDCNALPGHPFPGGCACANNNCANQRVNCNIFRYGQCNTQIGGVTAVVCRMVVCQNPGSIPALNCSSSVAVDDAVCAQDTGCLQAPALELVGAGGV